MRSGKSDFISGVKFNEKVNRQETVLVLYLQKNSTSFLLDKSTFTDVNRKCVFLLFLIYSMLALGLVFFA